MDCPLHTPDLPFPEPYSDCTWSIYSQVTLEESTTELPTPEIAITEISITEVPITEVSSATYNATPTWTVPDQTVTMTLTSARPEPSFPILNSASSVEFLALYLVLIFCLFK